MTTRTLAAWSLLCVLVAPPASAQAVRSGQTFAIGGTPLVVTPAIAYDPVHDRYLVVQAHGFVEGLLTDTNGQTLVDFTVNASRGAWPGEYAQTPMVAFAGDVNNGAGGYLVTWQESVSSQVTQARGRLVSADGAPLGTDFLISTEATAPGASTNWQMPASLAYSPTSHEFLVAWMGSFGTSNDIRFNRVSAAGAVLQALPTNVTNTTPDWERDPSVAYNPDADEFFVGYAGYHNAAAYSYVGGQRVKAGTGQLLGGLMEFDPTVATYIPSVTYNTISHQYLMAWYHATSSAASIYGIKLNGDGSPASQLILESSFYASYDALDLEFNSGSGDYLIATQSHGIEDAAISITSAGIPYDNGFIATATSDNGNHNPRIAANPGKRTWLLVTSGGFATVLGQFVQSENMAGPPPPVAKPQLAIDLPTNNATVLASGFVVAGWAADLGASSGTGVDGVVVWAFPTNGGSPTFAGWASYGGARPDVGAAVGAQFTSSGYALVVSNLAPGSYTLEVSAHSTVNNSWNTPTLVSVNVMSPYLMSIDTPTPTSPVSHLMVHVGGWAADLSAAIGSGVDAIHVWAYDATDTPWFLGYTTTFGPRPDVAAALNNANLSNAGYDVVGSLPTSGSYTLVVYMHSSVTNTFVAWRTVGITTY